MIKHPVIIMGDYIYYFEKKFYKNSKFRGALLSFSLIFFSYIVASLFSFALHELILSIFASMFLAHNMLYKSVFEAVKAEDKPKKLSYLVSRDTKDLSNSDLNKALIETYSENLSDGVIAPLLYLFIFGFEGVVVYKAINTLDSMVGYKNQKYKNFGYFSAKIDDIANFIPARLTAFLIMIIAKEYNFKKLYFFAKGHKSPNAGFPITAIALKENLSLGGDTSYEGKVVKKPYFGEGRYKITDEDVLNSISIKTEVDTIIISVLSLFVIVTILI